jgi:HlyD family secretion protein
MECVLAGGLVSLALLLSRREEGLGPRLGQLAFVGFAAYRLLPALQQAFAAIVRVSAARPAFDAIAPDLRAARTARKPIVASTTSWEGCPRREITLRSVAFHYAGQPSPLLRQVSLRIAARTAVGLVGANGSGKTTLVDIIAGLLPPNSGEVQIDGVALDDTNRLAWSSRIAYVPQNVFLLDASIAQNIALGIPKAAIDPQRLLAAAQLAQLHELVQSLPAGYDYQVGERGRRLSGGQRQRIAIARALYTDASVLILDEATSALDGLTEHELLETLVRLRGSYTIVLIAHRLSALRACDAIFELRDGEIATSGSYVELLRDSEALSRIAGAR